MNDADNSSTHSPLLDELGLLETETFEISDHTEAEEILGSNCCSSSTSCCSTSN